MCHYNSIDNNAGVSEIQNQLIVAETSSSIMIPNDPIVIPIANIGTAVQSKDCNQFDEGI